MASPSNAALSDNHKQWLAHLESARQQNLSLADYAKKEKLNIKRLYSWKSQLNQRGLLPTSQQSSAFVKARIEASPQTNTPYLQNVEVLLSNGIKVNVPLSSGSISALIKELSSL